MHEERRRRAGKAHEQAGEARSARFARGEDAEDEAAGDRARHAESEVPEETIAGPDDESAREEPHDEPYDHPRPDRHGDLRYPNLSARGEKDATARSLVLEPAVVGSVAHIGESTIRVLLTAPLRNSARGLIFPTSNSLWVRPQFPLTGAASGLLPSAI
jgi:hypothetical protein